MMIISMDICIAVTFADFLLDIIMMLLQGEYCHKHIYGFSMGAPLHEPFAAMFSSRLSFDLDWTERRLVNIRVDGVLVAEEDEIAATRKSAQQTTKHSTHL